MRKSELVANSVYHVFTKSIADYKIFNNINEFLRMVKIICYYQSAQPPVRFSQFFRAEKSISNILSSLNSEKLLNIIAYCLMPTHIHLILEQIKENGISIFMSNTLNSYTRYFNTKHNRKGPLWESRFKSVLVESDEQLLHLTRYVHLNPVTAYLVNRPEDWHSSSYKEYLLNIQDNERICKYGGVLDINPKSYTSFVEDNVSYQRELAKIKALSFE